jgi:hypothetical protein
MDIESTARIRYNDGCELNEHAEHAEHAEHIARAKPSAIIPTFFVY